MDRELLKQTIIERFGSVAKFAQQSGIGADCLSLVLRDKRNPSYETQCKLIRALGLTGDEVNAIFYADVVAKHQHKKRIG